MAGVLVILKSIAWGMTNALSLQASLIDSLLDVGASVINFLRLNMRLVQPIKNIGLVTESLRRLRR